MIEMKCQRQAYQDLASLAKRGVNSVVISGPSGCGKTYLAKQYSLMLDVPDFQIIEPTVSSIRTAIDSCYQNDESVVLCIENLDTGVLAASYTLLKFLEEPLPKVHIVVTCQNVYGVPNTILSRCSAVEISPCIESDIEIYCQTKDANQYSRLHTSHIWSIVRSFADADTVMSLSDTQLQYFRDLHQAVMPFKNTISNLCWNIEHYSDNSASPVRLVIRYILACNLSEHINRSALACLNDLSTKRIGTHAVVAKFVFDCKYCE